MHTFQLVPLDPAPFAPLFALPDAVLQRRGIVRRVADRTPGFPCRVSLQDAQPGDELLLLPFVHLDVASPYRSAGPIFVRRGARAAALPAGAVPPYVTTRLISLRAYDSNDMMIDAAVVEGTAAAAEILRLFGSPDVTCIHLHNARRGCYSCRAVRA